MLPEFSTQKTLVLIGEDYAHLKVLQYLRGLAPAQRPIVMLVARERSVPHPGLIPAFLRGQVTFQDIQLDLHKLCVQNGFYFCHDEVTDLDVKKQKLSFNKHPDIHYDYLSIGLVADREPTFVSDEGAVIPLRSASKFIAAWRGFSEKLKQFSTTQPPRLAIFGDTSAAAQTAFLLHDIVRRDFRDASIDLLFKSEEGQFSGNPKAAAIVNEELEKIGVQFHEATDVIAFAKGLLTTSDRKSRNFDFLFWAGAPQMPKWLRECELAKEGASNVAVDRFARSESHPNVFIAGDFSSRFAAEKLMQSYAETYGENVKRMAAAQKSFIEIKTQQQQSFSIDLPGGRALWLWRNFTLRGKWLAKRHYQKYLAEISEAQSGDGEVNDIDYALPKRIHSDYLAAKFGAALTQVKHLKIEFNGEVGIKASSGCVLFERQLSVVDGDFASWLRILLRASSMPALAQSVIPKAYNINITLAPLNELMFEFQLKSIGQTIAAMAEDLEFNAVNLNFACGAANELQVVSLSPAKASVKERSKANLKQNHSLILTHALGSGEVLQALMKKQSCGIDVARFERSLQTNTKKLLRILKADSVLYVQDLRDVQLSHYLYFLTQSFSLQFSFDLTAMNTVFHDQYDVGSQPDWLAPLTRKDKKDPILKGRLAELQAVQYCSGLLLHVKSSVALQFVEELRAIGCFDAAIVAQAEKSKDSKYAIDFVS